MALVDALATVMEPILLFWQSTTSVLAMLIPKKSVTVVLDVKVMDPVPVAAPIVFPVMVPILATVAPAMDIPVKSEVPALVQLKFWMVLPCMLLAVPVAVVIEMGVNALFWTGLVQAVPAHNAADPPM